MLQVNQVLHIQHAFHYLVGNSGVSFPAIGELLVDVVTELSIVDPISTGPNAEVHSRFVRAGSCS